MAKKFADSCRTDALIRRIWAEVDLIRAGSDAEHVAWTLNEVR